MRKLFLLFLAAFIPWTLSAKTAVIYHTSDVHGFFYASHGTGGYAALASVLKREPLPYLLLDGGDFSNGSPEASRSKGLKSVELMNALYYDAATLGNHEFYFEDAALENMLTSARFPVLAANLADAHTGERPARVLPYKLFNVNGVRIAVIGLASTQVTSSVYKLRDGEQALRAALAALAGGPVRAENNWRALSEQVRRQSRAQAVVLLVHNSPDNPYAGGKNLLGELPRLFPGQIHAVLGGHLHQTYIRKNGGVLFAESGAGLKGVSRIEIETDDETGLFKEARASYIPLVVEKTGQDARILALGESLKEPGLDDVLGRSAERLTLWPEEADTGDGTLSDWMADLFKEYTGAEVFIHNVGAMRKDLQAGDITRRDLEELFPHDNTFVEMDVPGSFLRQLAEKWAYPRPLYIFAGMRLTFERTEKGVKLRGAFVNGEPLDDSRVYRVAVNSYVAQGNKEGYLFRRIPAEHKRACGQLSMRDVIVEGFKTKSPLRAPETGRIRFE